MKIENKFYVSKVYTTSLISGYLYESTGEQTPTSNRTRCIIERINVTGMARVIIENSLFNKATFIQCMWFNANMERLSGGSVTAGTIIDVEVPNTAKYLCINITFSTEQEFAYKYIDYINYKQVIPHYTQLKKQYKKESGQMFFREQLEGGIKLFGEDYEYIKSFSIEDKLLFDVFQNGKKYITTAFNKTDCKFDYSKHSVELQLIPNDMYTNVLSKLENTYDLIKLAPAIDNLILTKRSIVQIYIQGESVISSYAGGTYWETEVNEVITDEKALENKYYFAKGRKLDYKEVSLSGFNYDINASFKCEDKDIWNGISKRTVSGQVYNLKCSIVFAKVNSKGDFAGQSQNESPIYEHLLSTGKSGAVTGLPGEFGNCYYIYDMYRIEIYNDINGTGLCLYKSDNVYAKDTIFTVTQGDDLYPMTAQELTIPYMNPEPNKFNLGSFVTEYSIWARLLCDVVQLSDGTPTYELPYDDFAVSRANYKRCIGLTGFDGENSIIKIYQNTATRDEPTAYGMDDYGKYFYPPSITGGHDFLPLSRSAWANTALWVYLETSNLPTINYFELWCSKAYKKYVLKDCYSVANVIKVLLKQIDENLSHEATEEYSQFLYGFNGASAAYLQGHSLFITQKTNILKGEYDQAAQKAEITLAQVLNMLRDCFRCYWFIDSDGRFRIEHVSYFMNGFSYNSPGIEYDLTKFTDKFNKKNVLYGQQEISFDKSGLISRYEFNWMDDSTDSFGNLTLDVKNKYVEQSNTEDITVDNFSTDIDYMLFMPEDFSEDGFALLAAKDGIVPIASNLTILNEKQNGKETYLTPQNWIVSWNMLVYHYMYDMPGNSIEFNHLPSNNVVGIMRCMEHDITFQNLDRDPNVYKLITTYIGNGYIDEITVNIDTRLINITLTYQPS